MLRQTLFAAGQGGYHTYRIPSLIALPGNRLIAFCEGRMNSMADYGAIHVLCRISDDGGRTFGPVRLLADDGPNTIGNPTPVYDPDTHTLFLFLNGNLAEGHEGLIMQGKAPRTVLLMRSHDLGETWTEPEDLTALLKKPEWTWYAFGPCHALRMDSGRLVIPANHATLADTAAGLPYTSHVVCSDDHGQTWYLGGETAPGTNECSVCQLSDGRLYLNMRAYYGRGYRAVSFSTDGGLTWTRPADETAQTETVCQGSVISDRQGNVWFLNAAGPGTGNRVCMTLRKSADDGRTWPESIVLHPGPAAYGDMALLDDGMLCLFECGENTPYERIDLMRL